MQNAVNKVTPITRCLVLIVCVSIIIGCRETPHRVDLGSGYFMLIYRGQPVRHIPGHAELWHVYDGKHVAMVWPRLVDDVVVTSNCAIFNGGSALSASYYSYPGTFIHRSNHPVIEITENLTRHYARTEGMPYESLRGQFAFRFPDYTNGTYSFTGWHRDPRLPGQLEYLHLVVSSDALQAISKEVEENAENTNFMGVRSLFDRRLVISTNLPRF